MIGATQRARHNRRAPVGRWRDHERPLV